MAIVDPIEQAHNLRRLEKAGRKIKTARGVLFVFAVFYLVSSGTLFFLYNLENPDISMLIVKQMSAAIIFTALAILSYRAAFISFALTVIIFAFNFPGIDGIREQVTFLLALVTIFILAGGLTFALNYDQLKETLKP